MILSFFRQMRLCWFVFSDFGARSFRPLLMGYPAPVRYWTLHELLTVAAYSPGGYSLYDSSAIAQVRHIRHLQQEQRLSIEEIQALLNTSKVA
jgi:hypothetical protein